jgi:hypothetical protein
MLKRVLMCVVMMLVVAESTALAAAGKPKVRVSAWYWLNSAPKENWEGDFVSMKHLGMTDVLLCWGVDLGGIVTRKAETKQAMEWAHKAGIGVYLIVWQPSANSLPRDPQFLQVDVNGKQLNTLDTFNPKWRATQWKGFLQEVARLYAKEPAMAGYVFDDSFGSLNVSYGEYEKKVFGEPLPRKPADARWDEWTKARQGWWEDWAKDTVRYIRDIDPNREHEIYLEDTIGRITNRKQQASTGLDFSRVAQHFDSVGGYTSPRWTTNADSQSKVLQLTTNAITSVRNMIGPEKKIVYTFWSANIAEEFNKEAAKFPTAQQIKEVCDAAMSLGVRHLDMYGYRIGEYRVGREQMAKMMPAEPAPYVLTGQFPQKFMWDRPELLRELGPYLRGLNGE